MNTKRVKFTDLALGARFQLLGHSEVYVLLGRGGNGQVAQHIEGGMRTNLQALFSAFDTALECQTEEVDLVLEDQDLHAELASMKSHMGQLGDRLKRAERTLNHDGYTDRGGSLWIPPLGPAWVDNPEAMMMSRLWHLIEDAKRNKLVITIDLVPNKPLAMGNYEMRPDVRQARERATPRDPYENDTPEQKDQRAFYTGTQWTPEQRKALVEHSGSALTPPSLLAKIGQTAAPLDNVADTTQEPFIMLLHPDNREVANLFKGVDIDKAHGAAQYSVSIGALAEMSGAGYTSGVGYPMSANGNPLYVPARMENVEAEIEAFAQMDQVFAKGLTDGQVHHFMGKLTAAQIARHLKDRPELDNEVTQLLTVMDHG